MSETSPKQTTNNMGIASGAIVGGNIDVSNIIQGSSSWISSTKDKALNLITTHPFLVSIAIIIFLCFFGIIIFIITTFVFEPNNNNNIF